MAKTKKSRAERVPSDFRPIPTVFAGGLDRMIAVWERSREVNAGGYGPSGFLFKAFHDSVTPCPVHVHEVETFAGIARSNLVSGQHHRFSGGDPGNDPGVEPGARGFDFPIGPCFSDKHAHAACQDLVSRNRPVGFNHVCLKGRVIQQRLPNTKGCAAPRDLVSEARRLNVETFR